MCKVLFIFIIVISLAGCMVPNSLRISYPIDDIKNCESGKLADVSISILPFTDIRRIASNEKDELFSVSEFKENCVNCVNLENFYLSDSIASDITQLLAQHLRKSWCYKAVYVGASNPTDFRVTGKLADYYGNAKIDEHAKSFERGASQFGLIGGLVAEVAKTSVSSPLKTKIMFDEVEIRTKNNNVVKRLPPIVIETYDTVPAVTNCFTVYQLVDDKLKNANALLASKISKIIEEFIKDDGEILVDENDLRPKNEAQEKTSSIIFITGERANGIVDKIDNQYVTYRKNKYEQQIRALRRNVRSVITGRDTVHITN